MVVKEKRPHSTKTKNIKICKAFNKDILVNEGMYDLIMKRKKTQAPKSLYCSLGQIPVVKCDEHLSWSKEIQI